MPEQRARVIGARRAAEAVARLHAAHGGATYSLRDGDRAGLPLFAVSLFPERTRRIPGPDVPAPMIQRYIERNMDLLRDRRVSLGMWFDADQGVTFLDLSVTLPSRDEAEELARRYNQIGIYDLHSGQWIKTGGTGEELADLPPEVDRLSRE